ncbi:hypothetical protein [Photobacterium damselae]|uniref:hypothetical protein n=1 Tax=Photobacterium damselae TaxID=38293 RepID=UPI0010FE9D35|nr:hypothetical protein [Photobacterium damselae]TLS80543.1 hypothetical protein FD721_00945 [Photobacterium damselae subsp. damselae]TLS87110.1 hypothetical protein FD720_09005 [Photobacterium damselae subsp. damselae]
MARNKDASRKALLDAISRIKEQTYTNKELKKKKVVKLNRSNVEKEAGLSAGALRHHPDIVKVIQGANPNHSAEDVVSLAQKIGELEASNSKLKAESTRYKMNAKQAEDTLKEHQSEYHQIVTALFFKIPIHEREEAIKSLDDSSLSGNVTNISEYRRK